jgi:anti-sigma-K factor RskA
VWAFILNSRAGNPNIPPGYQLLAVQPQEGYTSTAVALFNPDTQEAYLYANSLQSLPLGKVYELWLLPPTGDPVAAGVFTGDASGRATHRHSATKPLREYKGFAVTIEDAPGVPAPTGPLVMVGQYQ